MNSNETFEEIKNRIGIREIVSHYYMDVDRNHKALCPFHSEKTPSFSIDEKENIFKCFGCGEGGDAITFVSKIKEVQPLEAAKIIDSDFHLGLFDEKPKPTKKVVSKKVEKPLPKKEEKPFELDPTIKPYLQECAKHIEEQTYMQGRGLTIETLKKFKVGYDSKKNAITIPYSNAMTYYQLRFISEKRFYKPEREKAGDEPIYNERALANKTRTPIFVVESPICAMSVAQEGGIAIATCGTGCINKLTEALKKTKPRGALILCFDNDVAGEKAYKEITSELDNLKVKYLTFNIAPDHKDPNEMLVANKDKFDMLIQEAIYQAKKLTATKYDIIRVCDLQDKIIPEPFWVIKDILPEGLAMLTAASKVGKSWLAQQICIEVARGGEIFGKQCTKCESLYLALEDSERRLIERSYTYMNSHHTPPGYHATIFAPTLDTGLLDTLQLHMDEHPGIKLIVIDTLQRVRGLPLRNETTYATDYRELGMLKEFADNHHICILLLHHVRKMADQNDAFNMINGSNGMMGVLDTSWLIYKKNRMDLDATLLMTGRDISQEEWVISKGKNNGRWDLVGNAEQQEEIRRKDEYLHNPIVKVIKALLERQPNGWQGTVAQFKMESIAILNDGTRLQSDTKVGIELNHLTYDLGLDGIIHEVDEKKTKIGKRHYFYLRNKYTGKPIKTDDYEQQQLLDDE